MSGSSRRRVSVSFARRKSSAETVAIHVVLDIPCGETQRPVDLRRSPGSRATRFEANRPGRLNSEASEGEVEDALEVAQAISPTQCAAVRSIQIRNRRWIHDVAPVIQQDPATSIACLKLECGGAGLCRLCRLFQALACCEFDLTEAAEVTMAGHDEFLVEHDTHSLPLFPLCFVLDR